MQSGAAQRHSRPAPLPPSTSITSAPPEQVLTLPIRGADREVRGDGPEADFVRETLGPMLGCLIDQRTPAIWARKAFFEKVWTVGDGGRAVSEKIAWRPPPHARRCSRSSCGRSTWSASPWRRS